MKIQKFQGSGKIAKLAKAVTPAVQTTRRTISKTPIYARIPQSDYNVTNQAIGYYLSQSEEAAVNALEFGRILGLKPGAKYPGAIEAKQIFAEGINSDPIKLSLLKNYKWDTKPKRV